MTFVQFFMLEALLLTNVLAGINQNKKIVVASYALTAISILALYAKG